MSSIIWICGPLAALSFLFAYLGFYKFTFQWNIKVKAFMGQIQKLIMANNVDRAVKLCNAEPHAMVPQVVKELLVRSQRPYSLYMAQEQAMLEQRRRAAVYLRFDRVSFALSSLTLFALTWGFSQELEDELLQNMQAIMVFAAVGLLLAWFNQMRIRRHLIEVEASALRVRGLLYSRAGYRPLHFKPLAMTQAELEAWEASMGAVEADAVKKGPGTAADIHDSRVDRTTGVLPPL